MTEIKFFELKCQRCGGELERRIESGAEIYVCQSCGKTFEKQIVSDVADQLRSVLDEQKQEAVANLRQQLWKEMHEQYINSAKIVELSRGIKKYLPDDYFANFCEIANSGNDKQVNAFLRETSKENMADYADVVLDFMLKSLRAANITELTNFIEKAFKGDTKNYDKYTTKLETEAEKVNSGIYELTLTRDVFLAYSSADMDRVIELCEFLENNGLTCFLALRNLRHGREAVDNYDKALKTAIDNCKTVVFVSSTNSRSLECDALTKELPYIKQKDLEAAPPEFKRAYDRLPQEYMMPRVQYLLEEYVGDVAEYITKEFFHDNEWCKSKEAVAQRVTKYITEVHETTAQRAEREKREFQQRLEEERTKAKELELRIAEAERKREEEKAAQLLEQQQKLEEERRKAKELELRIAEMQKQAAEAEQKARLEAERRAAEQSKVTYVSQKVETSEDPNAKYCKKCRTANRQNAKFCSSCGSREFFADFEEYLASKIKFCADCGAQNNAEDKFCAECGSTKFVPTEKAYYINSLVNRLKVIAKNEEERQRKLREEERRRNEEEERKRREEEERKRREEEERRAEEERKRREEEKRKRKIQEEEDRRRIAEERRQLDEEEERQRKLRAVCEIQNDVLVKYKGEGGDVEIPAGVTEIGKSAFYECKTLTSVKIHDRVTKIGYQAFNCCIGLKKLDIPKSVTKIGAGAFQNCPLLDLTFEDKAFGKAYLKGERQRKICADFEIQNGVLVKYKGEGGDVEIPVGVTEIGEKAFYKCGTITSVKIPNGVTTIGDSAFSDCTSLASITITDGVTSISNLVFRSCSSLTSITIGDSVTTISDLAFCDCTSLTSITVSSDNTSYKSIAGNLYSYDGKTLIRYAMGKKNTSFIIPNGVTTIGSCAFVGCSSLKSITIPNSVTTIRKYAFYGCRSLTSVTIPDRVTYIFSQVFSSCYNLKTIYCRLKKPLLGLPKGWDKDWLGEGKEKCKAKVIWDYKG